MNPLKEFMEEGSRYCQSVRPSSVFEEHQKWTCKHREPLTPAKGWAWIFPTTPLAVRMGGKWAKWGLVDVSDTISAVLQGQAEGVPDGSRAY